MKKIVGLLILTIGIIFLLSNIGVIDSEATSIFSTFWPVLIVIIGLKVFFEGLIYFLHSLRRDKWYFGKPIWGALITAIGIILLGNNAGWFSFGIADLWSWTWPVLIVYIGFKIIFDRQGDIVIHIGGEKDEVIGEQDGKKKDKNYKTKQKYKRRRETSKNYHQFIGDIKLGKNPWELDGADISMGIGSVELDLTKAILKDGENIIEIRGWIGSVEIHVPREMAIRASANVRIGDVTLFDDNYSGTSRGASITSTNFYEADKKVILDVDLNIGDVEVLTID